MNWKESEVQRGETKIEKMVNEVRTAAYKSVEELWKAFLAVGGPDMVTATDKALRLVSNHSDYICAMKVLEGLYALAEIAPSEDFTVCQQYPALSQMFMDEFLAESEDFIFDMGMNDVLELVNGRE